MSIDDARKDAARAAQARRLGIPEWQLEAAEAVGTDVLRDIVADSRRSSIPTTSAESVRGSGWIEPTPLKPPDGVQWWNRLMDVQDHQDKLDRVREGMERRHTLAELSPNPKPPANAPRASPERSTRKGG